MSDLLSNITIGIGTGALSSWLVSMLFEKRAVKNQMQRDNEALQTHLKRERALAVKEIKMILRRADSFLRNFEDHLTDFIALAGHNTKPAARDIYRFLSGNESSLIWDIEIDEIPFSEKEVTEIKELEDFIATTQKYFHNHVHYSAKIMPHHLQQKREELAARRIQLASINNKL